MLLRGLKATPALDYVEFPTLEAFQAFALLGDARNTPLSGRCASARAHVALPSCNLTIQRTFPRILENQLSDQWGYLHYSPTSVGNSQD